MTLLPVHWNSSSALDGLPQKNKKEKNLAKCFPATNLEMTLGKDCELRTVRWGEREKPLQLQNPFCYWLPFGQLDPIV